MITEAYPLHWPLGWKRTDEPKTSRFGGSVKFPSVAKATAKLKDEIRLFGADGLIISSNLELKKDGMPYSNRARACR